MKTLVGLIVVFSVLSVYRAYSAETNAAPPSKVIAIVNAAEIPSETLLQIKQLAAKALKVQFETATVARVETTNLLAAGADSKKHWRDGYAAMVVLVTAPTSFPVHASFNTNTATSVINVTAMSADSAEVYRARLVKQVVRGAVFALGMKPSKDPLCVTRDYRVLPDLDKMPPVLFPPWQHAFEKIAVARGMSVAKPVPKRQPPVPPVTPPAPQPPAGTTR